MRRNRVAAVLAAALLALPAVVLAEEPKPPSEQVIEPQLDRREVKVPHIDASDFEIGAFTGLYSAEDFGSSSLQGVRIGYHITEDIFFEGTYARTKVSDEMFRNILPGGIFENPEEELRYYSLSVGFNFFPGEVFIGRETAMASAVYVIAGIGNTNFIEEDRMTVNAGIGIRLLITDWFALHVDMRDHIFESDILGEKKTAHNFELSGGLSFFF
jgi:outer membrane beta-barrel protein